MGIFIFIDIEIDRLFIKRHQIGIYIIIIIILKYIIY